MNGLGNTFWIFDIRSFPICDIKQILIESKQKVNCDQVLIVSNPNSAGVSCKMMILNKDGSEASACGNGTRCVSKFLGGNGHKIETCNRILETLNHDNGLVTVSMGSPLKRAFGHQLGDLVSLSYGGADEAISGYVVDIGNPHFILINYPNLNADVGSFIENHQMFPDRINVNFVEMVDRSNIRLVTYERGVGFTKACGTGSCASAYIVHLLGLTEDTVCVHMELGTLEIRIMDNEIHMTGDANMDGVGYVDG